MEKDLLSEENKFAKLKESFDDVLIIGPSGSGKGYLAKLLHAESISRSNKQFIHINSASINSAIFESEMFGHIKGSFTGAFYNKEGYCSKVRDGDLFLDEIGDLPLELQAKLLVLINDRVFMPVGSNEVKRFNGRIIAATNRDLKKEVAMGKFRKDLYYRLNGFVLHVKALREQKEKIPDLVKMFVEEENSFLTFDKTALEYFLAQEWTGNIRQLKNVVKRIIRYSDKEVITKKDIIPFIKEEYNFDNEISNDMDLPILIKMLFGKMEGKLSELIKLFGEAALEFNNGNITITAQNMGIGRKTLERMIKKYQMKRIFNSLPANSDDLELS